MSIFHGGKFSKDLKFHLQWSLFIWISLIEIHWIENGTIFIDHWNLNDFTGDPSMYIRVVYMYSLTHPEVKITSSESHWPKFLPWVKSNCYPDRPYINTNCISEGVSFPRKFLKYLNKTWTSIIILDSLNGDLSKIKDLLSDKIR